MTDTEDRVDTANDTGDTDDTDVVIGLFEPGVADDPHAAYARLRSECPVARGDMGGMPVAMISRYEDVQWALRHPDAVHLGERPGARRTSRCCHSRSIPRCTPTTGGS